MILGRFALVGGRLHSLHAKLAPAFVEIAKWNLPSTPCRCRTARRAFCEARSCIDIASLLRSGKPVLLHQEVVPHAFDIDEEPGEQAGRIEGGSDVPAREMGC